LLIRARSIPPITFIVGSTLDLITFLASPKKDWYCYAMTGRKMPKVETLPDPAERNWSLAAREFLGCLNGVDVSEYWIKNKPELLKRTEP